MFLITGTGRSGSVYIYRTLRAAGLEIEHERAGKQGAVSSLWLHDTDWYPGYHAWDRPEFDRVFLQVRHPLNCIGSLTTSQEESRQWILEHSPSKREHLVDQAAAWYLWQNRQALEVAEWAWRVEDVEQLWDVFQALFGFDAEYPNIPKDTNRRPHVQVTLDMLSPGLRGQLIRFAKEWDYEV